MKHRRSLRVLNIALGLVVLVAMLVPAAVAAPPKPSSGGPDLQAKLTGLVDAMGYRSGEKSVYPEGAKEVPGEVIVRLKNRLDTAAVQAWAAKYGARLMSSLDLLNIHQLKVDSSVADTAAVRAAIQADPNVIYATPNGIARISEDAQAPAAVNVVPDDPSYNLQWALPKEQAPAAWDIQKGDPHAIVMIIDTGIDYNHPDITGKYVFGYDFVNNDPDAMDDNNHGTHVAGKAAAWTNNNVGIAGLAWYSLLMAMKVCNASGSCTWLNVAYGVFISAYVQLLLAGEGFHVIANMSLGGSYDDPTLRTVVDFAYNTAGILMVASSGNTYNYGANYPAAYPGVVSVACTTQTDARCNFSTWHETVEASAPGLSIYSTIRTAAGSYGYMSGTSMSSPDVTGVAALVWAQFPSYTNAQVRNCLNVGVDDLGTPGRDQQFGFGRINALKAVQCSGQVPTPTRTPTPIPGGRALLMQDQAPWGTTSNQAVLAANSIPYDIRDSTFFASGDFSAYRMVIIAGQQTSTFYSRMGANMPRLASYVQNGGRLEAHMAAYTAIYPLPTLPGGVLPGAVHLQSTNNVLLPAHPLAAGVANPFTGNYASHSAMSNFGGVTSPEYVTRDGDNATHYTLVTYRLGNGKVVASTQPLEWAYNRNEGAKRILQNAIPYDWGLASWPSNYGPKGAQAPAGRTSAQ